MKGCLFFIIAFLIYGACKAQNISEVKEINTAGNAYPANLTVCNNKLFFTANDASGFNKLWVTGGDQASTVMLGPAIPVLNTGSNFVSYKNKLYFSCNDGVNGAELWVSDGTVGGTVLFKDIYTGSTGSYPQGFTVANDKLFFMANNSAGENRLYVTDGTVAGTICLGTYGVQFFNGLHTFAVLNNSIYYTSHGNIDKPDILWKSDGTVAGTVPLSYSVSPGVFSGNYAVLNNKLYFSGYDNVNGGELWVTDGTEPGTHIVKNLSADGNGVYGNSAPSDLTVLNSKIYFSARDDEHGKELFVTDGTAAGTQLVKDIVPGHDGSSISDITIYNGMLYFMNFKQELWKSDGTDGGTQKVSILPQFATIAGVWDGKMYINRTQFSNVYVSDGTTAGTKSFTPGNASSRLYSYGADHYFVEYNSALFFSGTCGGFTQGYQLVKLSSNKALKTFTFTGSGNWSNPANWGGGKLPPATILSGNSVVIGGNCILDVAQHIQSGALLTVLSGSSLIITGSLTP